MSNYIKKRKDVDNMAATLKDLGWTPSIGTISHDGEVRGFSLGVVVKIGDDRLKWSPYERNAAIDFFSIANIANGVSKSLARKPDGFNWAIAGVDQVHLMPNKTEKPDAFIDRLRGLTPPQMTFDFFSQEAPRPAARTGLRM